MSAPPAFDPTNRPEFVTYYAAAHATEDARRRFAAARDAIRRHLPATTALDVLDVGCGAGASSFVWAELGYRVHGVDVSADLLKVAAERAAQAGWSVDFRLGSATSLPWPDASMDVACALELLEHVPDWEGCLDEMARVLRPGGVLFVTTTNVLCPRQDEFELPLYSWYPGPLKRRCERLARRFPRLVNYATYPAVNWFSFYSLRRALAARGFRAMDRFDIVDAARKGRASRLAIHAIRRLPPARWLGHVLKPGTLALAVKEPRAR